MRAPANTSRVLNAFEAAAARAVAVAPDGVKTLDRPGRRRVALAPRVQVGFVIENREQWQAAVLRRAAMRRRSI